MSITFSDRTLPQGTTAEANEKALCIHTPKKEPFLIPPEEVAAWAYSLLTKEAIPSWDPRLPLFQWMKDFKLVPGYNDGGKRIELNETPPEHPHPGALSADIKLAPITLTRTDAVEFVVYWLTNYDLVPNDPRLDLCTKVQALTLFPEKTDASVEYFKIK